MFSFPLFLFQMSSIGNFSTRLDPRLPQMWLRASEAFTGACYLGVEGIPGRTHTRKDGKTETHTHTREGRTDRHRHVHAQVGLLCPKSSPTSVPWMTHWKKLLHFYSRINSSGGGKNAEGILFIDKWTEKTFLRSSTKEIPDRKERVEECLSRFLGWVWMQPKSSQQMKMYHVLETCICGRSGISTLLSKIKIILWMNSWGKGRENRTESVLEHRWLEISEEGRD